MPDGSRERCKCCEHLCRKQLKTSSERPQSGPVIPLPSNERSEDPVLAVRVAGK
nr:MAG TPA: hypothetical protein [Caudoviricetes sp.]